MLASRLFRWRCAQSVLQRGYLSQNFKETLGNRLSNTFLIDTTFDDILEMKKSGNFHLVPQLTSHLVIKNYLETGKHSDLLSILKNKLETRIFVDDYTGSCLLDHLINTGDHLNAVEIVVSFQEEFKNELAIGLALKSIYSYLKDENQSKALVEVPESNEKPEKKVRVGFLRNTPLITSEPLTRQNVGKTILNLIYKKNGNIFMNMHLIGLCLCEQFSEAQNLLKENLSTIHKDVLDVCSFFGQDKINYPAEQHWNTTISFNDALDAFVKDDVSKNEKLLMDSQNSNYSKWIEESNRNEEYAKTASPSTTALNAENIVKELEAERKLLWYFDNKDKIDLKLFQQKKVYPRKWFGKRKKPKTIDDKYVPPEITKRGQ